MAVPLRLDERNLGVLYVAFRSPQQFSAEDRSFLTTLGGQCAQALERARLYAEAQAAIRARDQFMAVASHELKTPLTTTSGYTQMMQRRLKVGQAVTDRDMRTLDAIAQGAQRLGQLVSMLLDFSRLQADHLPLERIALDLGALVQRTVNQTVAAIDSHPISVRVPRSPLVILGDELRLEQVVHNLLQNAVKYSPAGAAIEVRVWQRNGLAWLSVKDHGVGIPLESQALVFERFYRAPNVDLRHVSGMGIGLYVVREIVERHGGRVRVESRVGEGSIFKVSLPLLGQASKSDDS